MDPEIIEPTGWFANIFGSFEWYTIAGIGISAVCFALIGLMLLMRSYKVNLWHGVALGACAVFVATLVNNYTSLAEWITIGLYGSSISASLFVWGMIAFIVVVVYNLVSTRGRMMIR